MADMRSTSDFQEDDSPREPGIAVDGYKVLSTLGEGGFGIVYLAETEPPLRRRVALKVIKPGMDSKQVIARFEAERQALALMDHPNVAKVFDAGMTASGHNFFVMEHVKGVPLTEHCDRHKLSIKERLELLIDVAEAVQHAHQKGIVHRDLKPSNILVAFEGNRAVPKVIDFGISKAIAMPLTEKTLFTEQGQIIGTPEYMSPEQAEMTGQDIDTRTDVYSLGVVLYELLAGSLPFPAEYLRKGGLNHFVKVICVEEPKSPSTKLSSLHTSEANHIAAARQMEVTELRKNLKGDLDAIVLKAMEKDRQRRYQTAHALAMDLQRFLEHEPIVARRPSTAYKLQKFVRRNRVASVAALAVIASFVIGLAATTWGFLEANRQRSIAEHERDYAKRQRDDAREARGIAEKAEQLLAARAEELERQNYFLLLARADAAADRGDFIGAKVALDACPDQLRRWEWGFLKKKVTTQFSQTFAGAEKPYFTRDGRLMIAIGKIGSVANRAILQWNRETGKSTTLFEHDWRIVGIAVSPDEQWIAGGDDQGGLFVVNRDTGKRAWYLQAHTHRVDGVAYSHDGQKIASASWDGTVAVLDAQEGRLRMRSPSFDRWLRKVGFSHDDKLLLVGIYSGDVAPLILDASSGSLVAQFPDKTMTLPTVGTTDTVIATGCGNGDVVLWEWNGSELMEKRRLVGLNSEIISLEFSADGTMLAASEGGGRSRVAVWDVASGVKLGSLNTSDRAYWLAFPPGSQDLAVFTLLEGIRLWRFAEQSGTPTRIWEDGRVVYSTKFSPDSRKLLVGASTRDEKPLGSLVVGVDDRTLRLELKGSGFRGEWSPDGKRIYVSSVPGFDVVAINSDTGDVVDSYAGHANWSIPLVAPDGETLLSVGVDGTFRTWNLATGQQKAAATFRSENDSPISALFACVNEDFSHFAVASADDFAVDTWNIRTLQQTAVFEPPGFMPYSMFFAADGASLCIGGSGGALGIFSPDSAQPERIFRGQTGGIYALATAPNGEQLVAGTTSGRIVVWDTASQNPLFTLYSGELQVWSVDWSPDGRLIAAGFEDGTIRIWNVMEPNNPSLLR